VCWQRCAGSDVESTLEVACLMPLHRSWTVLRRVVVAVLQSLANATSVDAPPECTCMQQHLYVRLLLSCVCCACSAAVGRYRSKATAKVQEKLVDRTPLLLTCLFRAAPVQCTEYIYSSRHAAPA
jgi:hypothetical protein